MAVTTNIVIEQGATFQLTVDFASTTGETVDVTGFSACSQCRRHWESTNAVDMTTSLSNSVLVLSLTANQTTLMEAGRYVYDARLFSTNVAVKLVQGIATVVPGSSR